jgi:UDP-N-acetylmuramyl pentapeptide synthase
MQFWFEKSEVSCMQNDRLTTACEMKVLMFTRLIIRMKDGSYEFDVLMKGRHHRKCRVCTWAGCINVENIVAAVAVARTLGIGD